MSISLGAATKHRDSPSSDELGRQTVVRHSVIDFTGWRYGCEPGEEGRPAVDEFRQRLGEPSKRVYPAMSRE